MVFTARVRASQAPRTGTSVAKSVQEQLAATRSLHDHVLARLRNTLDRDRVSDHEPSGTLARVVRLGHATVLVVTDVCPEGPGLRSRLRHLERHPHQLLVHCYPRLRPPRRLRQSTFVQL